MTERQSRRGPETLADALRRAIQASGLSYNELRRRAGVNQAQISRFMQAERDITLQVASRLCLVLGLELVQAGPVLAELEEVPASTRGRPADAPPPVTAYQAGQGRRVDLEAKRGATGGHRKHKEATARRSSRSGKEGLE